MRIAIYARVSTSDKEQDPETQLMALRDYCGAHDVVVYDTYVDKASFSVITSPSSLPLNSLR